ncbi:MAG: putative quinol monooxygenase [Gammaproteobacteria bacterium]
MSSANVAILARLEAKPGKADEVAEFLKSALPLALDEPATTTWYALKIGPTTFGIFDTFPSDDGRQAHLTGAIAEALFARAEELFSTAPDIAQVDVLAAKLP